MYDVVIIGAPGAAPTLAVMLARDGLSALPVEGAAAPSDTKPRDGLFCLAAPANDSPSSVTIASLQAANARSMIARPDKNPERRLAAIFAADAADYSRLMGEDEVETLRMLMAHREVMEFLIAQHRGRVANTAGDSVLAEFASAVDAVQCATAVQDRLALANETFPDDRRLQFRIGVHVGDVMIQGGDLFGDGVNIAARLQTLAEPGGLCLSAEAHVHIRKVVPLAFAEIGLQHVKNLDEPVKVYSYKARLGELTANNLSTTHLPFTNSGRE